MDPILRRSLPLYLTHFMTWAGILGTSLRGRELPAFEITALFVPVWLAAYTLIVRTESFLYT